MRYLLFIAFSLIFGSCQDKQNAPIITGEKKTFKDTLRNESRRAQLLFFRNFATSKMSLLIKDAKDQNSIDALISFVGYKKNDTACYLFAGQNPVGQIYFYKDTSMTKVLADLYFALDGTCSGFYGGIDKGSPKYDLTTEGKLFLIETRNRVQHDWNK